MGVYNCANTLSEALDSLLSQTYQNFKVIICDDASADNTFDIAKKYVDLYPEKFILIKNETNKKLAATLNKCLEYVDTEYVARMDGDDISLPNRFQKQINFLDNHPEFALVSSAMIHFDEEGDWGIGKPKKIPSKNDFKLGSPFAHAPCMIRRKVLTEVGGYSVSEKLNRGQDYYLWYKIYKKGYKGYNINEPLYKMRDDKNALKRRTFYSRIKGSLIHYEVLKGLNIPFALLFSSISFIKAFIPSFLMEKISKKKLKINT